MGFFVFISLVIRLGYFNVFFCVGGFYCGEFFFVIVNKLVDGYYDW